MQFTSVYPQKIQGRFRSLKDTAAYFLVLLYLLASWIRWERPEGAPQQAILIDLPGRKGYFFGIEIWPTEVYYITSILICAALGLFFVTSVFGRLWCGFGCPHTVFVDFFIKIESFFQGDRNARMKLDAAPWTSEKLKAKVLTHAAWFGCGFIFAFGWVCYFYDAPSLVRDMLTWQVTPEAVSWLLGLTISTYIFAGFAREKVCTYMCPYGRFQSAMLDKDSLVVTYHRWRGEPRGKEPGSGDCIDCGKCVNVCPMGIDIRDGLQLKCIGCGLCIDACDSVMQVLKRPTDLIGFDSVNTALAKQKGGEGRIQLLKAKNLIFITVFMVVMALSFWSLAHKPTLNLSALHSRGVLYTILPDGSYRNIYTLKITNMQGIDKTMKLTVDSPLSLVMMIHNLEDNYRDAYEFALPADQEIELEVYLKTEPHFNAAGTENTQIEFVLEDVAGVEQIKTQSVFILR